MSNLQDLEGTPFLVCPETKRPLRFCPLSEADRAVGAEGGLLPRSTGEPAPFGPTQTVLLREDNKCAYPVIDGIPILMGPERLSADKDVREYDFSDSRYAETYEEMTHYNEFASKEAEVIEKSETYEIIKLILQSSHEEQLAFPHPKEIWIDAVYDCAAQFEAYEYLSPVKGKRLLQIGGKGTHAVKWLLAGAKEAWVATPMLGEARCAIALAKAAGVAERLRCVVLIAEELPFAPGIFDGIYTGGSLHHMVIPLALAECARVLRGGGKFSAVDPWKAPLHTIGTRILGKREPSVHCKPMTQKRIESLYDTFRQAQVRQHGTLFRYPLLAMSKLGVKTSLQIAWRMNRMDDALCSLVPGLRKWGSSIAILAKK